jgi:hypothetical protein
MVSHKLLYRDLFDNLQPMAHPAQIANEIAESRVSPDKVWEIWEKAHAKNGQTEIKKGQRASAQGKGKSKFQYEILDVVPKQRFSILWKSLFVRLIFIHEVRPTQRGCQICYQVEIKGFFARPIRWLLAAKIRQNIALVLRAIVKQLENDF